MMLRAEEVEELMQGRRTFSAPMVTEIVPGFRLWCDGSCFLRHFYEDRHQFSWHQYCFRYSNSLDLIAIRGADKDSVARSLKRKDNYFNLRRADDDLSN